MWERYFNLEEKLRRLTELPGVLGYLIFDCCRDNPFNGENVDAKKTSSAKPMIAKAEKKEEIKAKPKEKKEPVEQAIPSL